MRRRLAKPPPEPKIWPTSFRLPPDLRADLEIAAAEQRRPLTFTITEILRQWQAYWRQQKKMKIKPEKTAQPDRKEAAE